MRKSDRTRQYIIAQTAPIFNKKGFDGTSLQDMVAATSLTKGALYGNFADKSEIAMEAFRYSVRRVKSMVRKKLEAVGTNRGQLEVLLDFYAEYVFKPPVPGGCPMLNAAIECDDHRTSMRRAVGKELSDTIAFISGLLKKGIRAGEFRPGINTRELAYIFFCSVEGALMFSRVERSAEAMDVVVRHCKKIITNIAT